jgi:hypothetical protein
MSPSAVVPHPAVVNVIRPRSFAAWSLAERDASAILLGNPPVLSKCPRSWPSRHSVA